MGKKVNIGIVLLFVMALAMRSSGHETETETEEQPQPQNPNLKVLTDDTFNSVLKENPYVLVKFYTTWCGHCKALAPEYSKLANLAHQDQTSDKIVIAKIDATENEKASKQYNIEGFPTLLFFVHGKPVDFRGGRQSVEMYSWLTKFVKSYQSSTLKTVALIEAQKMAMEGQTVVVAKGALTEQIKWILSVVMAGSDFPFFYVEEGKDQPPTLQILSLQRDSKLQKEITVKSVQEWLIRHNLPNIVPLKNREEVELIFKEENSEDIIIYIRESQSNTAQATAELQSYCRARKQTTVCTLVEPDYQIYKGVKGFLKIEEEPAEGVILPSTIALIRNKIQDAWVYPEDLSDVTVVKINQFVNDCIDGKIQKRVDEEKAKAQKQIKYTNVLKLTSQTYNSTIADNSVLLIEYYSPSCGHCIKFAKEYEELATEVKEEGLDYVIAAVNLVENQDVSSWLELGGYPTFKVFINGFMLDYEGTRGKKEMLDFLKTVVGAKLLVAESVREIPNPSVVIRGSAQQVNRLNLHRLPVLFTAHPIYHIESTDDKKVVVELHGKTVKTYEQPKGGEINVKEVVSWLESLNAPVLLNFLSGAPHKKLQKAVTDNTPIVTIINRGDQPEGTQQTQNEAPLPNNLPYASNLIAFCEQDSSVVCAYANRWATEFGSLEEWLEDPWAPLNKSRIILFDVENKFAKLFFEGDVNELTVDQLTEFVAKVRAGQIKPTKSKAEVEQEQQAKQGSDAAKSSGQGQTEAHAQGSKASQQL